MKVLTIHRGTLELERVHLLKPVITIGRAPTNDIVLRAPGVAPLHFLIEWIGAGEFDPHQSVWTITDISRPQQSAVEGQAGEAGEGVVLSDNEVKIGGFTFKVRDDALEAKPIIGGKIKEKLKSATQYGALKSSGSVLEVIQIRSDSGAVEDVRHISAAGHKQGTTKSVLKKVPQLRMQWVGEELSVLTSEMPGVEVYNRGQKIPLRDAVPVRGNDVIQLHWEHRDFYVRFVPMIHVPPVKREFVSDPLLKRLSVIALIIFLLLFGLVAAVSFFKGEEEVEPPRVATIEIKTVADAPKPPPPPPPPPPEPPEPKPVKTGLEAPVPKKSSAQASVSKFKNQSKKPSRPGLNNAAKQTNVNQVGVLGAIGGAKKGPGVRADMLLNQGVATDALSSRDEDARVRVRNPPTGVIGSGNGGSPQGRDGEGLVAAQTTFSGGDSYDPSAAGPISRKGGRGRGFEAGSSLGNGAGSGVSRGRSRGSDVSIGSLNNFEVKGGLDKETVRRVIDANRGKIRTCYERALLSKPSLDGRIVYRWNISPSGPVTSVVVNDSTVGHQGLEACVLGVIKQMNFPAAPNGNPTIVIYPFVFQARN